MRFAEPGTKGSGLGLSLSRTIAERDGGAVRGESTPGVGSSFWLELPGPRSRPWRGPGRFHPRVGAHVFLPRLGR